jgi:hypothetical protein
MWFEGSFYGLKQEFNMIALRDGIKVQSWKEKAMNSQLVLRKSLVTIALAAASVGLLAGCSGDTGGGSAADETFEDSAFVSTEGSVGALTLSVRSSRVSTSSSTGFTVSVTDVDGAPVGQIRVSCDTERGLALIEPNTGTELTDSFGTMSGVVGCEAPGSFQIGCRLPVGGNKRRFATIVCEGNVPAGFAGFPGAGGGGLFGGVAVPENGAPGGTGVDGIIARSVTFDDGGQSNTLSLDTTFNTNCDGDPTTVDPEPFTDSIVKFNVQNDLNQNITLTSYSFSVPQAFGTGTGTATSSTIAFSGPIVINAGSDADMLGLFLRATGAGKFYPGVATAIPDLGFRNITFRINGSNDAGEGFTLVIRSGASIGGFDRCS